MLKLDILVDHHLDAHFTFFHDHLSIIASWGIKSQFSAFEYYTGDDVCSIPPVVLHRPGFDMSPS